MLFFVFLIWCTKSYKRITQFIQESNEETQNNNNNDQTNFGQQNSSNRVSSVTGKTASPIAVVGEVAEKYFSSVRTRTAIEPQGRYLHKPKLSTIPKQLEMDYGKILNKPYFISNLSWSTTTNRGSLIGTLNIPGDILTNPLVRIPFDASVLYRAKISVVLQVAGTPMHNGLLLAAALPNGGDAAFQLLNNTNMLGVNKLMAAPHVFLSANEATPVILEVPFYVNTKLAPIALDQTSTVPITRTGDYADVVIMVMDALGAPASAATTLTVSAHFIFDDIEFYVPHVNPTWVTPTFASEGALETAKGFVTDVFDSAASGLKSNVKGAFRVLSKGQAVLYDFIDSGREWIRSMTGLHNPADATITTKMAVQFRQNTNVVDAPMQIEKLDPYSQHNRFVNDYVFDTDIDEMLVSEIISKPMYVGSFDVTTALAAGSLVWARPITPFQESRQTNYVDETSSVVSTIEMTSLFQSLHYLSRLWRGSIKVHIQSAMSNFHFCKLTLARNYSPDLQMVTSYPSFDSIPNLMMETMEFVGHQVHTIELPYCSTMEQLPCSTDPLFNALQHGMYYIYVHQPLITNGTVVNSVKFNVYVSAGEDFKFFGYASRPLLERYTTLGVPLSDVKNGTLVEAFASEDCPPFNSDSDDSDDSSIESSDSEFESESEVLLQDELLLQEHDNIKEEPTDLRPIVSVRDFMRRFNRTFYLRIPAATSAGYRGVVAVDIATLLGVSSPKVPQGASVSTVSPSTPLRFVQNMFCGYSGGARFKIGIVGSSLGEVYYAPPSYHIQDLTGGNYLRSWNTTDVFPPVAVAPPGGNYLEKFLSQFQFAEKLNNAFNNPFQLSPLPMQERPNYIMNSTRDISYDAGADPPINRMNMSTQVFEVEIPNMAPFRFMGDASKGYQPQAGTVSVNTAATGMGFLIIKLALPHEYDPGVTTLQQDIAIEIMAATDDVGRAGYQVFAPSLIIPAVRLTNATATGYYQIGPDSIRHSVSTVSLYPSYTSTFTSPPTPIMPAYDYTKTLYLGQV